VRPARDSGASGRQDGPPWAAVLIVALSLIADLAIVRLDPRIRSGGRPA
jgi:hypothetical protein